MKIKRIGCLALAFVALLGGCAAPSPAYDAQATKVLAPTGKLRLGLYPGSPTSIIPAPAPGDVRGVGHDVGRDFARRLGVPFEPVVFEKNADVQEAAKAGRVDLVLTNATPARTAYMDFSPTLVEIEQGMLVPRGSAIVSDDQVDRPGVRVGVSQGSTSQAALAAELKQAKVVPTPNLQEAARMLADGKIDVFSSNKAILFEMSDGLPGSKVLPRRWGLERLSFGIPKGRQAAMPVLERLVAAARADGTVKAAIDRAGVRGTVPATAR